MIGAPQQCEWFLTCQHDAVALVAHPVIAPVPTCQRCIDRCSLAERVVARLDLPASQPAPPAGGHIPGHFFRGVCICPCDDCTEHVADGLIMCTCPDCPVGCGAKRPTKAGVR